MPRVKNQSPSERTRRTRATDFSTVGGLSNHIKILRDTIIMPLLHSNVYSHFNIKTPRGVLFYGPPGTGKTLVAGALATELNREGFGKVSFYQRKGADVLDKWVGESEKKLRALFETATQNRPSIIFFDELDGLAPIRSAKNDHVHCSIVTTLLALMDGLDSVPGVIVIGATNRIESVDPALRRTGRFDRELYFPLPSTEARKEILEVHMQTWLHKPSQEFVAHLAEITPGFCGSDLQALCSEALLCAMKRLFPDVQKCLLKTKIKIEATEVKIEECDFLEARKNLVPHKLGSRMRKLNPTIAPLLQKQLDEILSKLRLLWPHFFDEFHNYVIGSERYVGRMVLVGSNVQGLNTHLVPAILQNFEHLPAFFLDANALQNRHYLLNFSKNLPSILIISHVDDLWNFLEIYEQSYIASVLEDVHAELPILVIVTCEEELPLMLQNFFYNNTSVMITIENPTEQEVEKFFFPLFFGDSPLSLSTILGANKKRPERKTDGTLEKSKKSTNVYRINQAGKVSKKNSTIKNSFKLSPLKEVDRSEDGLGVKPDNLLTLCGRAEKKKRLSVILTDLLQRSFRYITRKKPLNERFSSERNVCVLENYGDSNDNDKQKIYNLWKRTVVKTAENMSVSHLEVLYDTIAACINIHKDNFQNLIKNLEETLTEIETTK